MSAVSYALGTKPKKNRVEGDAVESLKLWSLLVSRLQALGRRRSPKLTEELPGTLDHLLTDVARNIR